MAQPLELTLLCGVPAAGKTSWARHHDELGVLLADVRPGPAWFHREAARRHHGAQLLSAGRSIVVDGCNFLEDVRANWRRVAHQHRAATHLVLFDTPSDLAHHRNRARSQQVDPQALAGYVTRWPDVRAAALAESWARVTIVSASDQPAGTPPAPAPASPVGRQSRDW